MKNKKNKRLREKTEIRILFFIDNLACGGKERRLISLIKELVKLNYFNCELALVDEEIFYEEIKQTNIKIHVLKRYIKRDPSVFYRFFKLCRKIKPDIIHSWGSMPSIYAVPAAKILGIKLMNAEIVNAPQSLTLENIIRTKFSFCFSDLVVSNSEQGLVSYNAPQNKSACIYNGFDFKRNENLQSKESVRERFGITTKYVVGMVSAVYPKKDYLSFILAAIEITKCRDDVTFLIVGDGEKLPVYKTMTTGYKNIIYTGTQNSVESIINIFDIGVLATNSKLHGEGISNSIIEYMSLAKPVIASKGGGTSEIVQDTYNGLLYESRNLSELIKKINLLLDNPELAVKLGREGYKTVKEKFSLDKMVKSTLHYYYRLTGIKTLPHLSFKPQKYKKIKPSYKSEKLPA